jgi:hypothetical protein
VPKITLRFAFEGLPASYFIRYWSYGFKASHVEAITPDDRFYIGSRYPDGVMRRMIPDHMPWESWIDLPCTQEQQDNFFEWAYSTLGTPYDMPDLLANFMAERDWHDTTKAWCSEWVAIGLQKVNLLPPLATRVWHVTPRDLALAISATGIPINF